MYMYIYVNIYIYIIEYTPTHTHTHLLRLLLGPVFSCFPLLVLDTGLLLRSRWPVWQPKLNSFRVRNGTVWSRGIVQSVWIVNCKFDWMCLQDEVLVAGVPLALMLPQLLLLKPAYAHWTAHFHVHIRCRWWTLPANLACCTARNCA